MPFGIPAQKGPKQLYYDPQQQPYSEGVPVYASPQQRVPTAADVQDQFARAEEYRARAARGQQTARQNPYYGSNVMFGIGNILAPKVLAGFQEGRARKEKKKREVAIETAYADLAEDLQTGKPEDVFGALMDSPIQELRDLGLQYQIKAAMSGGPQAGTPLAKDAQLLFPGSWDDPEVRAKRMAYMEKERSKGGTRITINDPAYLGKKAVADLQTTQLNTINGMARLRGIQQSFKPEFQELGTRIGMSWKGLESWLGTLDEDDKRVYQEYVTFRRRAQENLNLYIKEITGAQMSEAEAERLSQAVPVAGVKMWQGDDPAAFEAKMNDIMTSLYNASARYNYMMRHGISDPDEMARQLSLDAVPALIDQRDNELYLEFQSQNPGMGEEELEKMTDRALREEFGLQF